MGFVGLTMADPVPESTAPDPEIWAEALAELRQAEPVDEDLAVADLAADLAGVVPDGAGRVGAGPVTGLILARGAMGDARRRDWLFKAELAAQWFRLRLRQRGYRDGSRVSGGSLEVRAGRWAVSLGGLGVKAGLGLLSGAPGRSPYLAAGGSLPRPAARVIGWTLEAEARSLIGGAVGVDLGPLRVLGYGGQVAGDDSQPVRGILLSGGRRRGGGGALVQSCGTERGLSVWGHGAWSQVTLQGELAQWQSRPQVPWRAAFQFQASWRGDGHLELRGILAASPAACGPGRGLPGAVIGGWGGRGWSLSGHWRHRRGHRYSLLLGRARRNRSGTTADWLADGLIELKVQLPGPGPGRAELRLRRQSRAYWQWSAAYPWLPAGLDRVENKTTLAAQYQVTRPGGQVRALARAHQRSGTNVAGIRYLWGLDGRRDLGRRVRIRGSWWVAWGDPVDLIGAVVPVGGLVIPRHWGHWSSEIVLGLEWRWQTLRWAIGGTSRTPDPPGSAPDVHQAWVDMRWAW